MCTPVHLVFHKQNKETLLLLPHLVKNYTASTAKSRFVRKTMHASQDIIQLFQRLNTLYMFIWEDNKGGVGIEI